jgi:ADP-heptose:LPS heptosyltransferase
VANLNKPLQKVEKAVRSADVDLQKRPIAVLVDREGLGDALLKLPFLRAVRRAFPGRPLWWIATHQTSMAHEMAPWVADLIDRTVEYAGLTEPAREVIPRLRALPPFELIFDSRTRFATVLLARALLSYRGFYACLPGYMLSTRRPPGRFARPDNIADRMLSLADAAIGGPAEAGGEFELSAEVERFAAKALPAGRTYVGLATGSREARKNWPTASFIALAERLQQAGLTPVFLIGPQERELVEMLRAKVPSALFPEADPVDPALQPRPLELAMAIGRRLAVAVANDSGIGHLLGILGTPLLSLFGPTDPARWRPYTSTGVLIRAQQFGGEAMEAIPVEPVFAALSELITASAQQRPASAVPMPARGAG